jgi:hypothetical protein
MSVSVMRPFVMAVTAARGVAVPVARYLAVISSGTVIATETQSLPATEIRKGLCEGDMVVANAGSSLHDGDIVRPILADAVRTELR